MESATAREEHEHCECMLPLLAAVDRLLNEKQWLEEAHRQHVETHMRVAGGKGMNETMELQRIARRTLRRQRFYMALVWVLAGLVAIGLGLVVGMVLR